MNITQEELEYELWSAYQQGKEISLMIYTGFSQTLYYVGKYEYEYTHRRWGLIVITLLGGDKITVKLDAKNVTFCMIGAISIAITSVNNEDPT